MNQISDNIAKDMICDPVDCKLVIAKHFLGKITPSIPNENSFEHFLLEANIDAFLFFSSSVIDMIKVEINDRFDLFDKENVFYIHGIRKKLGNSGIQKQVKDIIAKYFSVPTQEQADSKAVCMRKTTDQRCLDAANSTLWELQILRNKGCHGRILNIVNGRIILDFTVRSAKEMKNPKYQVAVEDPEEYFAQIFNNLASFVGQIRLLNPQKAQSAHHAERMEFRLE